MKILEQREQRAFFQNKLLQNYHKTLIVIKANYPSANKNNLLTSYLTCKFFYKLKKDVTLINYFVTSTNEGLIFYLIVDDSIENAKKIAINYENSELGRLVDIDVYSKQKQLSRADLGIASRKCFICNDDAKICVRSQKHSVEELIEYFNNIVIADIFTKNEVYGNLVLYGLINELNKPYGFGCVGINTKGSHQDMDMKTFLNSIEVLSNKFNDLNEIDLTSFLELREIGKVIENDMFKATMNVNTHKGAIFSLLLILAGLSTSLNYDEVVSEIKKLTSNILDDFKNDSIDKSFGMKLYQEHKITGVRGYAYNGYEILFNDFEPYYESTNNDIYTYLYIIHNLEDTTIIKRGSYDILIDLQDRAYKAILDIDYENFNDYCLENNLSCGGSADMLACMYIVNLVKNNYDLFKEVLK
ncbi:holo-ACP synthase/triphosphoribosyl-dephospho-CoA synthase [Bacilli bacterium PM5-3]|nr:holo-ACP synthase/triphosphoribosyl-dephospho-CoA synthase [Bacilli bacterium PM5-3]MDH6603446.1 holo-ACP synthase/triphosphoribosyl-dephospho-CoA synthase [Bacilli bacterium PM5-9]